MGESAVSVLSRETTTLLDALEKALVVADAAGRVVFVSARAEARIGRPRAELVSMRVSDVVAATPPIAIRHVVLEGAGAVTIFELAANDDDASAHVLEVALAQSGTGTELADLDGRILWVNQAFTKLTGYAFEEIVGQLAAVLRPERADPELYACILHTVRSGASFRGEVRRRRKDGSEYDARLTVSPVIDPSGAIQCLVAHHDDITEAKRLELKVLRSERLASVGQLAAGLAHEVNSPLTYTISSLEVGLERLAEAAPPPPAEIAEMLRAAHDGATRVRDIVRGIRLFSRVDGAPEQEVVDLSRVIEDALALTENDLRHRARVVRELGPGTWVRADRSRLAQVFVNLLVNAAQAMPVGAAADNVIAVAARTAADGRAIAEVRDTGPGIPDAIVDRVFEPFFTTKAVGEGMGLGLAVCQGIVHELGGELAVETRVGAGTTFRVVLPAAEPSAAPPQPSMPLRSSVTVGLGAAFRPVVLVIDDDDGVRFAVERILAFAEVLSVASGVAALALLAKRKDVDVVLCDLMMPEMGGWDVHARLIETDPALASRMVFLSGGAFTTVARSFLDRVENARVEKPFTARELRDVVRAVAARARRTGV